MRDPGPVMWGTRAVTTLVAFFLLVFAPLCCNRGPVGAIFTFAEAAATAAVELPTPGEGGMVYAVVIGAATHLDAAHLLENAATFMAMLRYSDDSTPVVALMPKGLRRRLSGQLTRLGFVCPEIDDLPTPLRTIPSAAIQKLVLDGRGWELLALNLLRYTQYSLAVVVPVEAMLQRPLLAREMRLNDLVPETAFETVKTAPETAVTVPETARNAGETAGTAARRVELEVDVDVEAAAAAAAARKRREKEAVSNGSSGSNGNNEEMAAPWEALYLTNPKVALGPGKRSGAGGCATGLLLLRPSVKAYEKVARALADAKADQRWLCPGVKTKCSDTAVRDMALTSQLIAGANLTAPPNPPVVPCGVHASSFLPGMACMFCTPRELPTDLDPEALMEYLSNSKPVPLVGWLPGGPCDILFRLAAWSDADGWMRVAAKWQFLANKTNLCYLRPPPEIVAWYSEAEGRNFSEKSMVARKTTEKNAPKRRAGANAKGFAKTNANAAGGTMVGENNSENAIEENGEISEEESAEASGVIKESEGALEGRSGVVKEGGSLDEKKKEEIINLRKLSIEPVLREQPKEWVVVTSEDRAKMEHYWLLNEEYKLLVLGIPKGAFTTWIRLFLRLQRSPGWLDPSSVKVHFNRERSLFYCSKKTDKQLTEIMNDPSYTRAVFFREPSERLLSAYLDKFVLRRGSYAIKLFNQPVSFESFVDLIQPDARQKYAGKFARDSVLGLDEWTQAHWRPQTEFFMNKFFPYFNFIGFLSPDSAAPHAEALLRRVGAWQNHGAFGWASDAAKPGKFMATSFGSLKPLQPRAEAYFELYYTEELLAGARRAYAADYAALLELFGIQ